MQQRSNEESDREAESKRPYHRPEIGDFFDPSVAVVTATYSGAACAAPPKMPPP